jgi:hypothetical protein
LRFAKCLVQQLSCNIRLEKEKAGLYNPARPFLEEALS